MDSNVVRTASGSGGSMVFDWDGTGNGGTNIPDGNYLYYITVQTNGLALPAPQYGDGDTNPPVIPNGMATDNSSSAEAWYPTSARQAVAAGWDFYYMVPPPMPPVKVNGVWLPWEEVFGPEPLIQVPVRPITAKLFSKSLTGSATLDSVTLVDGPTPNYAGPSSQSTAAPTRPSTSPMKNSVGTYGVAYIDWGTSQTVSIPKNGIQPPLTGVCHLDTGGNSVKFDNIPEGPAFEVNFIRTMKKGGWKLAYDRSANSTPALHANNMRRSDQGYGGGELFTTANIGLFLNHGSYGTDPDYSAGSSGSYQTYFRISTDSGDNGWLRMCQIGFGGDLKWLGLLACNSLSTYSSMSSKGAIPLKTTHMVCGTAAVSAVGEDFGAYWAKKMLGGVFKSQETVANAWFDAGHDQYQYATNLTGTITFRVAGYPECMSDTIKNNVAPSNPSPAPGNLTKVDKQVYP